MPVSIPSGCRPYQPLQSEFQYLFFPIRKQKAYFSVFVAYGLLFRPVARQSSLRNEKAVHRRHKLFARKRRFCLVSLLFSAFAVRLPSLLFPSGNSWFFHF